MMIESQKKSDDQIKRNEELKKHAHRANFTELNTQINSRAEVKKQERNNYLEEGRKVR